MKEDLLEHRKKHPVDGLVNYFSKNFPDSGFEYGSNKFGICRYPLNSNGERIVEELEYCPHTLGLDGGYADKSESIASIITKGDTSHSIYFHIIKEFDNIYPFKSKNLDCQNIDKFINRVGFHLNLINKKNSIDKFNFFKSDFLKVFFTFKYDAIQDKVSRIASVSFLLPNSSQFTCKELTVTDNNLTSEATMRKIDIEFFHRYYKNVIKSAIPELSYDQLYEFIDISKWDKNIESIVKMTYY